MTADRGFGIAGALDHAIVRELARSAEQAGYATFWANDTPTGDGLAALRAAADVTSTIGLGVGVIPIDRKPPSDIEKQIAALDLPQGRLILGIGSGALRRGARRAVREAALELGSRIEARVVVGALGPRMGEIGGASADGVLLNWLTPEYLAGQARIVREAAAGSDGVSPWIGAYVRVAVEGPAYERLQAEANRYAEFPQYEAHFNRMGVAAIETCVYGRTDVIAPALRPFEAHADEVVVRAIAAEENLDAYLEVLHAGASKEQPIS